MHFLTFFYLFKPFLYFLNILLRLLLSLCLTGHLLPLIGSKCFLPFSCMWITFSCFFDGIITFYWKIGILGNVTILDSDTYPPPEPLCKSLCLLFAYLYFGDLVWLLQWNWFLSLLPLVGSSSGWGTVTLG